MLPTAWWKRHLELITNYSESSPCQGLRKFYPSFSINRHKRVSPYPVQEVKCRFKKIYHMIIIASIHFIIFSPQLFCFPAFTVPWITFFCAVAGQQTPIIDGGTHPLFPQVSVKRHSNLPPSATNPSTNLLMHTHAYIGLIQGILFAKIPAKFEFIFSLSAPMDRRAHPVCVFAASSLAPRSFSTFF